MYRIEVATGDETVFRTIEELATGIRNGLITPRSRIYHAASQKWLAIELHPHYKKALDLVTGGAPMIDTGVTRPTPRRTPAPSPAPGPTPSSPPALHTSRVEPWRPPVTPKPAPAAPPAPTRPPSASLPPQPSARPAPPPSPAPVVQPRSYLPPEVFESRDEARGPAVDRSAPGSVALETATAPTALAEPHTSAATPDLELPHITYPDVPPPSPREPHPVARRRPTPRASLLLVAAVAATLVGGYLLRSSGGSDATAETAPAAPPAIQTAPGGQESEYGPEGAFPEESPAPAPPATHRPAPVTPSSSPAPSTPLQRPTGPVSQAWSSSAGAIAPIPAPAAAGPGVAPIADAPAISPPPAAMKLTLPKQLPSAETIGVAAEARRDSAAMRQILRAVSGKAAPARPSR